MKMNIRRSIIILLHCLTLLSFSWHVYADETNIALEDTIAGIKLGATVEELLAKFPGIYKNQLDGGGVLKDGGVVLYEACNQRSLETFSFAEEPWSKGHITNIWVRKAKVDVCRDSTGSLPDYSIIPATPRGVKLGDKEDNVIKLYGTPTITKHLQGGEKMLTYKETPERKGLLVKNLSLHFTIIDGYVSGFHLFGDMPGAKKPL